MRMKVVVVVVGALLVAGVQSRPRLQTVRPGLDLTGKMFTLSWSNGGVTFYPGSYPPPWSSTPSYTRSSFTPPSSTRSSAPTSLPSTTAPPTRGFSVCVRYMADSSYHFVIFKLFAGWNSVTLSALPSGAYYLSNNYQSLQLTPKFKFWPDTEENLWTSICLTKDHMTNITQLFQGSRMSVRAIQAPLHMRLDDPVIEFPGFSGQVTDLQLWDYPLSYKEVYNYMSRGLYRSYRGSLISWSYITYSNGENSLLEDQYNLLAQQPRGGGRGGRGGGHLRKSPLSFSVLERASGKKGRLIF